MHARAEEFGGKFELISQPGSGTSVAFSVPYTTAGTPREYRRRAVAWGVLLVISILVLVWTKRMAAASAIAAIGVVRYLMADRRARMRSEAAQ